VLFTKAMRHIIADDCRPPGQSMAEQAQPWHPSRVTAHAPGLNGVHPLVGGMPLHEQAWVCLNPEGVEVF
jgi:hypothetical protein